MFRLRTKLLPCTARNMSHAGQTVTHLLFSAERYLKSKFKIFTICCGCSESQVIYVSLNEIFTLWSFVLLRRSPLREGGNSLFCKKVRIIAYYQLPECVVLMKKFDARHQCVRFIRCTVNVTLDADHASPARPFSRLCSGLLHHALCFGSMWRQTETQCWLNVGPASKTMGQH